nr:YHS domain-containing protein [Candidatus Omnitrophota bacterium]
MQNEQKNLVDVDNNICPVSGEEIKEEAKATYEYEGKIYNFCCPMCIDEFKKYPEKYIEKIKKSQEEKETEESQENNEVEGGAK